jgi:DNA-binding transcriptional regulator YiaG
MKIDADANYNPDPKHVRKLVDQVMEKHEIPQSAVAALIGISCRTLRYWLSGDKTMPYSAQIALDRLANEE